MKFINGFLIGLLVVSCASFTYKYYGLNIVDTVEESTLLGPTPAEDLPLIDCKGDSSQKGKCVVMFVDEFERLRTDIIDMEERLKRCEAK